MDHRALPLPPPPPSHLRRRGGPGAHSPHAPQRHRARQGASRLPVRGLPRHRQDEHGQAARLRAQLGGRPAHGLLAGRPCLRRHRSRHLARRGGDGRRLEQLGRRHPRATRERRARADGRRAPRLHPRRGPHAHPAGLERVPQDARGAAGARGLRAGHHRGAQGPGHDHRPLPPLRLPPAVAPADRRGPAQGGQGGGHRDPGSGGDDDRPLGHRQLPRRARHARAARHLRRQRREARGRARGAGRGRRGAGAGRRRVAGRPRRQGRADGGGAAVRLGPRPHPVHARAGGPPAAPVRGADAGRRAGVVRRHRRAHRPAAVPGGAHLPGRGAARHRPAGGRAQRGEGRLGSAHPARDRAAQGHPAAVGRFAASARGARRATRAVRAAERRPSHGRGPRRRPRSPRSPSGAASPPPPPPRRRRARPARRPSERPPAPRPPRSPPSRASRLPNPSPSLFPSRTPPPPRRSTSTACAPSGPPPSSPCASTTPWWARCSRTPGRSISPGTASPSPSTRTPPSRRRRRRPTACCSSLRCAASPAARSTSSTSCATARATEEEALQPAGLSEDELLERLKQDFGATEVLDHEE